MSLYRKTAIVRIELPSGASAERLPLTTDRAYGVILTIDGQSYPAGYFYSPINDEQWREFSSRLSDCNVRHSTDATAYRNATFIRGICLSLYKALAALSPQMQSFLDDSDSSRRLVVQTTRPELHLLPWGGLYSGGGNLLVAGDLSIVQSRDRFSDALAVTQSRLNLLRVAGDDTNAATAGTLRALPPEILQLPADDTTHQPDILHVEAHGDKVSNSIGGVSAENFGDRYSKVTLALLWSCYSSSANSWGDSPALCLHQAGAAMVLSFQAELHVLDAENIADSLYGDVFGPAANRNPELALVQIRADKYQREFPFANWASMTVFLRCPLDMSALPLNGPRVPRSQWFADTPPSAPAASAPSRTAGDSAGAFTAEAAPVSAGSFPGGGYGGDANSGAISALEGTDSFAPVNPSSADSAVTANSAVATTNQDAWTAIAETVRTLQRGSRQPIISPPALAQAGAKLPLSAFGAWRGNVIRLDGGDAPLTSDILNELDLQRAKPPDGHQAENLVWFFDKIAHYGSPLIVWTNSLPHHIAFLEMIAPSPALTFLFLGGPEPQPTIPSLVDQNRLEEARSASEKLLLDNPADPVDDEVLSAAYYACVRGVQPEKAKRYLMKLQSFQEWLLLAGNLFSRDRANVLGPADLVALGGQFLAGDSPAVSRADFDTLHRPEDFYRLAMNQPDETSSLRETGRAKSQIAYVLEKPGRTTAEVFARLALADLESTPSAQRDSRWHFALSGTLRDLADLLSDDGCRLDDASALLKRAMAIQAYHGMELQLGYSETTAARIALTGCHHTQAIDHAVDAANRMEACANWSGWSDAMSIFFDSLAETRETARMINLANLANEKLGTSNLSKDNIARQERIFKFQKAKAHWIAGDLVEAREELELLHSDVPQDEKSGTDREIDRLLNFLRVEHLAATAHVRVPQATTAVKVP